MAELANVFSWSRSRGGMFEECRRRYYYHYYGAWGGWDPGAPDEVRRLYVLKQLTGRQGWAGRVVHEAVGLIFWDARAQRYSMWAYRAGSGPTQQEVRLEGDARIWGFTTPGGEIRFTQRIDEQGRWIETGERSTDQGATWQAFLGMTLSKK